MSTTANAVAAVCQALYSPEMDRVNSWTGQLRRDINIKDARTARRLILGEEDLREGTAERLRLLVNERIAELEQVRTKLDEEIAAIRGDD